MTEYNSNNEKYNGQIGTVKIALTSPEGPAIISTVLVKKKVLNELKRIEFTGVVKFDEKLKIHILDDLLPQIDDIFNKIPITLSSYIISAENIGAISSEDSAYNLEGYSADIAIFIAILSSSLEIPIYQNIVLTGHISSINGKISQVKGLIEKIKAAVANKQINEFLFPKFEMDISYKTLKPNSFNNIYSELMKCKEQIKLIEVENTFDLIQKIFPIYYIVSSSLRLNYFFHKELKSNNNSTNIAKFLVSDNNNRFWDTFRQLLMNQKVRTVHELLEIYFRHFLEKSLYPKNIGNKLSNSILSIPSYLLINNGLFPLISASVFTDIIKYANVDDQHDINKLYHAINGTIESLRNKRKSEIENFSSNKLVDIILYKLSQEYIELNITNSLDEAIISFYKYENRVENYEKFLQIISNFYLHIEYFVNPGKVEIDLEKVSIESLDLLKRTYPGKNELQQVIYNAINGLNGGLKLIFDSLVHQLKKETKSKYILATIHQYIPPDDYELIKEIISEIIRREFININLEENKIHPEKYTSNYFEIIIAYAESKDSFSQMFINY